MRYELNIRQVIESGQIGDRFERQHNKEILCVRPSIKLSINEKCLKWENGNDVEFGERLFEDRFRKVFGPKKSEIITFTRPKTFWAPQSVRPYSSCGWYKSRAEWFEKHKGWKTIGEWATKPAPELFEDWDSE